MAKVDTIFIAIARRDGGVSIMNFVTKQHASGDGEGWSREPNATNINDEIAKSRIDAVSWKIITLDEVPADRTFRDAWTHDGKFRVDMPKAREIHKDNLRKQRAPLLIALDIEANKLITKPDAKKAIEIETEKQRLRDVTKRPEIEAARTPEELKAITV